jgi:SAM-dependent methyltransferase
VRWRGVAAARRAAHVEGRDDAMALSHALIRMLFDLRRQSLFGNDAPISMLELGEQNWYGDVAPYQIGLLIDQVSTDGGKQTMLKQSLAQLLAHPDPATFPFDIAKLFYRFVFDYERYAAVDLHGTSHALAYDLNEPLPMDEQFDIVTNFGTTEHVFNQYQAFKSIHERVKPGGYMMHSLPNQGCFDHGFFNYHPTFFYDLAQANGYTVIVLAYVDGTTTPNHIVQLGSQTDYVRLAVDRKLSAYSGLFCVFQAQREPQPFKPPRQGYYDNRLPPELAEAWSRLPR